MLVARAADPANELYLRTRWYIWLRWFIVAAIVVPSLASLYIGSGVANERRSSLILAAILIGASFIFYALSRRSRGRTYDRAVAMSLLAFDVLFISYFIYDKGGIESRSELLYALPILIASALFGRLGVYLTAAGSALAFDFVILANFAGLIHSPDAVTNEAANGSYAFNTVIFFTAALMLVAVLTDFLTRLLIRKEHEASQAAAALRRAQAIAKLGSWEWDIGTNAVTWSDELYDIFGVPKGGSATYESFLSHIHPEDREWTAAAITRSLKTHKPFRFENRIVRPDKELRIMHAEGKVVTDKQGRAVQLYGTAQDITAERALEVAKGDFVSLASHQLRTPASGVRMLLAMLRDGYAGTLSPEQLRTVEEAYEANERLLRIADDLLNVAKVESGRLVLNKQRIELCLWLKNVVTPQKLLALERRQKMRLEVPKGTAYLSGDPERLAMVLDNLLSNARKYTPPRGHIRVALQAGKRVHKITVSDTGSGMTRAEVARLFGKFTRLDNPASKGSEGTGLGLYLAKSVVDLHKGTIKVRSKPGSGSTFVITLPVSTQ